MAKRRRKSKAKQDEELLKSGFALIALIGFFGTYYFTGSLQVSIVITLILFGSAIAVIVVRQLNQIERLKKSGIADIDIMDGRQFEHYLNYLFKSQGYSVKVTRAAGDYGADLVLEKTGRKIVVQAKRYSKNIGIEAVQQVHSSINYYKASEAWVLSNRNYTEPAHNLAKLNGVRLIGRDELINMILAMTPGSTPSPKQVMTEIPSKPIACNRCGEHMLLRKSAKGEFYGCSAYPKCKNMKVI